MKQFDEDIAKANLVGLKAFQESLLITEVEWDEEKECFETFAGTVQDYGNKTTVTCGSSIGLFNLRYLNIGIWLRVQNLSRLFPEKSKMSLIWTTLTRCQL